MNLNSLSGPLRVTIAALYCAALLGGLMLLPKAGLASETQTPPANDNLADAIEITQDNLVQQVDLSDATLEANEVQCTGTAGDPGDPPEDATSVWYKITAEESVAVTITLVPADGQNVDPVLGIFTGSAHPLTTEGCIDDGGENENEVASDVSLSTGETIFIRVSGFGESNGQVEIRVAAGEGGNNGGGGDADANIWTGDVSEKWIADGNWSTDRAPVVGDGRDCVIPPNTKNPPVNLGITDGAFGCDGVLMVQAGAVFTAGADYAGLGDPLFNGFRWVVSGTVVVPNDYIGFQNGMDFNVAEGGTLALIDGKVGGFPVDGKPNRVVVEGTLSAYRGDSVGEQAGENQIERGTPLTIASGGIVEIHEGARLVMDGSEDGGNTVTNNGTISETQTVTQTTELARIAATNEGKSDGVRYYGIRFDPADGEDGTVSVGVLGNQTCAASDTTSVKRCFFISPNSIPSTNIRFYFLGSEGNNNQNPVLYRSNSADGPWEQIDSQTENLTDTDYDYVEASNLQEYGYFRLADEGAAPSSSKLYLPVVVGRPANSSASSPNTTTLDVKNRQSSLDYYKNVYLPTENVEMGWTDSHDNFTYDVIMSNPE